MKINQKIGEIFSSQKSKLLLLSMFFLFVLVIILIVFFSFREIKRENNTNIEETLNKGITYLVNSQNEDGSISLDNDETFKVWETANAFLAVHTADKSKNLFFERAANFLLSCQRKDGSFYSRVSFKKDEYCMETTPASVLALAIAKKDVSEGVLFMLNKQDSDGSWEIGIPEIKMDKFFPSVTGYVLSMIMCLNVSNDNISKGIEYLLKTQQDDGSWGKSSIYYDTPYYATSVNLLSLKLYGLEESDNYKRAISYIKINQNEDGSWGKDSVDRPSRALRTSLALNSLLISPDKSDSKSIEKGIKWLIKNQKPEGYWDGGYFVIFPGKKEDIFCTAVSILALERYESSKKNGALICPK